MSVQCLVVLPGLKDISIVKSIWSFTDRKFTQVCHLIWFKVVYWISGRGDCMTENMTAGSCELPILFVCWELR